MSCLHYKFASRLRSDMVLLEGLQISLGDLRRRIMEREKLKATSCHLRISNAQTQEEYTDTALIPRNSSVIVRRVPVGGVKAPSRTSLTSRLEPVSGTSKATDDLAGASASEEDQIAALMTQSCRETPSGVI